MSDDLMLDKKVRSVEWHDLVPLKRWEIVKELTLPLPWLALSLAMASQRWHIAAMAASFMFFLTGLRLVHDAFHHALCIGKVGADSVMFVLSALMLGSMHAIQTTHLYHHRHCLEDEDVEAECARQNGWKTLVLGPLHPWRLHMKAIKIASRRQRRWIVAELAVSAVSTFLACCIWREHVLRYHLVAMAIGQCMTAFFAVWTVHHDCDKQRVIARTLRNKFKSAIAYNMFYHVEHHLFPQIPTCHLPRLAERLDNVAPQIKEHQVF